MERVSKRNYYLDIAQTVLERATCLRRVYGAIIVKNDEIISSPHSSVSFLRLATIRPCTRFILTPSAQVGSEPPFSKRSSHRA